MKQTTRNVVPALLALVLLLLAGPALAEEKPAARPRGRVWAPPRPAPERLAQSDPRIVEVLPLQAIAGEPLVIGKSTVVRVRVGASAGRGNPIAATVALSFDGQELTQDVRLTRADSYVDFFVEPPAGDAHDIEIAAELSLAGGTEDGDPDNNRLELSWPGILMPQDQLKVFYLPVDWTAEQKEECEFDSYFAAYVDENTDFTRATYPLPDDQVVSESTTVPHMLSEDERQIVNSQYVYNEANTMNLFASAVLTGKTYAPDAELVAAVLPPRWLSRHANPRTAGFASPGVRGVTIVTLGDARSASTIISHEFGHIRQLTDDYSVERSGYPIDRMGYWVARKMPISGGRAESPYNFMGSAGTAGVTAWVDSRTYDHLLAKYVSEGGEVSRPMVLAATLAPALDDSGAPVSSSAGEIIYEPGQEVVLTVAHAGVEPGTMLTTRWLRGEEVVGEDEQEIEEEGFGYTVFELPPGDAGHALGNYRFELLSGDELVKSGGFTVDARWLPDMSIQLGDNKTDRSRGYRAGIGVSPVSAVQQSVFVPSLAGDTAELYGWLVAVGDGESRPREFDVDLRFVDPKGKQYEGEWVDDGKVRADSRLSESSYARKRLEIAGTDAARALGTWRLVAYAGGREAGSTEFTLAARGAATEFDRIRDAARAAGLNFVDGSIISAELVGSESDLAFLAYEPRDTADPYSRAGLQEVWAAYRALREVFPGAGTLVLQLGWSERYNLVYITSSRGWDTTARKSPSWDALRTTAGFNRMVFDLMENSYLGPGDAEEFFRERFGR